MIAQYVYAATVVGGHDGDTMMLDVDLGFYVRVRMACRLLGINAPELGTPGGLIARDTLRAMCPVGIGVTVKSVKPDKYGGRFDGLVALPDGRDVSQLLIAAHVAAPWDGKGPRPLP